MAIPEDRLSTAFVDGDFIPPEERERPSLLHDYEGGPIAIGDTSGGMNYQNWAAHYSGSDIILTPESVGGPTVLLTVPGVQQISFCFDQNARPSAVYITGTIAYLYWYDSTVAQFVISEFTDIVSAMLSLDDKRFRQVGANDIIFWYTKLTAPGVHTLFHRKQRQRFEEAFTMKVDCYPYLYKAGMHDGLRGKIGLCATIY